MDVKGNGGWIEEQVVEERRKRRRKEEGQSCRDRGWSTERLERRRGTKAYPSCSV